MTQTTFYSDRQLFASFYKNTLARLRGVALLCGVLMFITFPLFYFIGIGEMKKMQEMGMSFDGFFGNPKIYPLSAIFFFIIIFAAVVALSGFAYSFMHNKKSVDVFHSLPIRRPTMLYACFASVISWMFILEAICYTAVTVVSMAAFPVSIAAILAEFARVYVLTCVIAAICAFCAVCSNTSLDSAIFALAMNLVVPSYAVLMGLILTGEIAGFVLDEEILVNSLRFSPLCFLYQSLFSEDFAYTPFENIIYIAFVAVLLWISARIYVKRKSEQAQSNDISGAFYRFFIIAASVGGGMFFGYAINEIFGVVSEENDILRTILLSCSFTAAIYLLFSAITSRKVNPGKKGFAWLAVSILLSGGVLAITANGFFGMESYVPAIDEIESVKIYYSGAYDDVVIHEFDENGKVLTVYSDNAPVLLENINDIGLIRDIHSEIVDNLDVKFDDEEIFYNEFNIEYILNNKSKVRRRYYEMSEDVVRKIILIDDMEAFKRQKVPMLISPSDNLSFFRIKDGYGENQIDLKLSDIETKLLYDAMAQDTLNITSQMKAQNKGISLAKIELVYKKMSEISDYPENDYGKTGNNVNMYENVCFDVTQNCVNTITALNQLGLKKYTKLEVPQNLKAIVVIGMAPYYDIWTDNFWHTANIFNNRGIAEDILWYDSKIIYTQPEKIELLSENSTSALYSPSVRDNAVFSVLFTTENIETDGITAEDIKCAAYYMAFNDAPQFVKDDFVTE